MGLFKSETIVTPNIIGVTDGTLGTPFGTGEYVGSAVAVGSAVSLTTGTPANVITLTLTPGDWDLEGNCNYTGTGTTVAAGGYFTSGISLVSATLPTDGSEVPELIGAITTTNFRSGSQFCRKRVSVTTTTKVYLVASATFSAGTVGAYGTLNARRER